MTLRLKMLQTLLSALGMALVIVMVGALFPAVGDSIGKLDLPEGVTTLLGGADYGTITGWMRSEIGAVYGPLLVAYTGISVATGSTAGEEEAGILALIARAPDRALAPGLAKAAAVAVSVGLVALGTFLGLVVGRRRRRRRHRPREHRRCRAASHVPRAGPSAPSPWRSGPRPGAEASPPA